MPTCKHDPILVIPQGLGENRTPKISFYDAQHWDGPEGMFRVMIGKKWFKLEGDSRSFFSHDGLNNLMSKIIGMALGEPVKEPEVSTLVPRYTKVSWVSPDPKQIMMTTRTKTMPRQDECGEWRVLVVGVNEPVLLRDLKYAD